jgi:MacB-like periplasmic core domain/FtsX-like permease family
MVETFYFLPRSYAGKPEKKLENLLASYRFLVKEYDRILREGLLAGALHTFRRHFCLPPLYSDQKIIDTLIWKFVPFLESGALRDGRSFVEREGDTREVVISENLAARLWSGQTAVGRPLEIYGNPRVQTVVGVVGAIHATSLMDDPTMMIYFPNLNHFARDMALFVRSERDPQDLASAVRTIVARLDSQAAIPTIETMKQVAARSLAPRRFQLVLMISFAVVAFLLACMGIYGVLAFTTSRRTSEIGIRMALGARPAQILESIVLNGMVPVLIGIIAGLCVSVALSRVLQALLFQMQALNPAIYLTVSIVMAAVAALACYMPARRAASLNPLEALRDG